MMIKYFPDTDTLFIRLNNNIILDGESLDDGSVLEFDESNQLCTITIEDASKKTDLPNLSIELQSVVNRGDRAAA